MFDTDQELKAHALLLWANHIETGDVTLSANDVIAQNRPRTAGGPSVRALTDDQRRLVQRLRDLARSERTVRASR